MSWISSLFRTRDMSASAAERDLAVAAGNEVNDGLQRLARIQARHGVRLEEIENKLEGGFSDLRAIAQQAVHLSPALIRWDDLLDAADALDEAERAARADADEAMAEGLRAVGARIGRFLAQMGVRRERTVGVAPDPSLVRVVGSVDAISLNEGHVARVVRAAVTEQGRLLREGEVLIARRPRSPSNEEVSQ